MSLIEQALKKIQAERPQNASGGADNPRAVANLLDRGRTAPIERAVRVTVDFDKLRREGLMPPAAQERTLAEQYRRIKRPLIANAVGRSAQRMERGQLIMVASALAGEGKTFTAVNLALSIAREKDVRVVLVDADIAKGHVSSVFGISDQPGLLDALRDPAVSVDSLLLQTDMPSLCILPAGSRVDHTAAELLSSPLMVEIMTSLATSDSNLIAVLDSPPLLLTTESQSLAQIAGQIVIIVRAGSTPQQSVLDAAAMLSSHPAVSLVLNQSVEHTQAGYYYAYGGDARRDAPDAK